tara:strand:+ start:1812 stop:2186 length:375 start_codon:yes stop_codon:yes gene_type:complete
MPRVNKYCFDCGSRLKWVKALSTERLPNEFRTMAYTCEKCNDKNNVQTYKNNPQLEPLIKVLIVHREACEIPVETVNIQIKEYKNASDRIQKGADKRAKYYQDLKNKKEMMKGTDKPRPHELIT